MGLIQSSLGKLCLLLSAIYLFCLNNRYGRLPEGILSISNWRRLNIASKNTVGFKLAHNFQSITSLVVHSTLHDNDCLVYCTGSQNVDAAQFVL